MGTFKGTKGEWVAWEHTPNTFAIKPNGSRTELARVYAGGDVEVDEMKANAKLIAAAPEMLEALTNLKDEVVKECNIGSDKSLLPMLGYVQDAIRAIKKATE